MRKKKNLTILTIALLNLAMSFIVVLKLSKMVPINIFAQDIGKMMSKNLLYILPLIICVISVGQVIYRLKTMDKKVTTSKLVEDAMFALVDGILILLNWIFIYIGYKYTKTKLIAIELPLGCIIAAIVSIFMAAFYSTYPINKFGSKLGLRTKETLADEEIWRGANRFNGLTGFLSAIVVFSSSVYTVLTGINWYLILVVILVCLALMFYIPRLNAKMLAEDKARK